MDSLLMERGLTWLVRLFAAIAAGAIIGLEREWKGKAAGLRTIILISLGSCVFMIASEIVGAVELISNKSNYVSDPGRIAAQVVSGIGFLGAGAIIISRDRVVGLTTAAVVWVTAAIGLIIGLGQVVFGLLVSVLVLFILVILSTFERYLIKNWISNGDKPGKKRRFQDPKHAKWRGSNDDD